MLVVYGPSLYCTFALFNFTYTYSPLLNKNYISVSPWNSQKYSQAKKNEKLNRPQQVYKDIIDFVRQNYINHVAKKH